MLSLIVFLPLLGAALLLLIGNRDGQRDALVRNVALGVSLVTFVATLALWAGYDPATPGFQFVERHAWIPAFGIEYYLGVDGISVLLIVLTGFLTPLAFLSSWANIETKVRSSRCSCCCSRQRCSACSSRSTCSCSTCSGTSC